ncbi:MAG TPA: hypothetical protein DIW31_00255, partial [Bacteroidales bacterium]|nr:hypothetical protein [Bacteroidales bacterium]
MKNFYLRNFLMFFVTFLISFNVQASYLKNVPLKLAQPNGKVLNLYATGDEYYHWVHDENGYTIIKNPSTGFLCYAVLNDDELVASEFIVGEVSPASVGLEPWIKIPSWKINEIRDNFSNLEKNYMIQKTGKYSGPANIESKGEINNIVIYVRFAGESEYSVNQSFFGNQFNSTEPGVLSMHNYYDEVSYNTLSMVTHFLPANNGTQIISYQDSHPRSYFEQYDATTNPNGYQEAERTEREHTLLQAAVNFVTGQLDPGINIDNDGDGLVDNVCFIVQGSPGAWSTLLWPHKWSLYTKDAYINGKKVNVYNFQLQSVLGVSVLCHEMFHSIGAPDLYHYTDGTPDPVGVWDLMNSDNAQHMTQFMKWRYGKWIDNIPEITSSGDYTINPVFTKDNSCYKVKSPFSPTEYFVIEYRKKEKLDAVLPNEGLLIYRINTKVDGQGNRNGPPDELYVYRPGGSSTVAGDLNKAPFSENLNKTSINDKTNPDPFLSDGGIGGLNISNISSIGATMSFHIDIFNPLNIDAAATKIITPISSSTLTSTEKVKVLITNLGLTSIPSGLKINYKINGGSPVSQDYPTTLAAGKSVSFEFNQTADLSNPGVYTLEVYTTLASDMNTENDKVTTTIVNPIPIEYLAANASSTIGAYTDLTTGSIIAVDNAKNGLSAPITFPDGFVFKFCGTSFTKFILSTNGFIKLGEQNPSSRSLYYIEPQTAEGGIFNSTEGADNTIIAPFAEDLIPGDGGAEYRIDISGTAPNRIVTIQFKNVSDNGVKLPTQYSSINFQIKLYEESNIIEFVYGLWTPSSNTSVFKTSLCGLRGLGNFASQLLAVNKGSTQAWGVLAFTNGNYSTTATLNFGNTNGGARPAPEVGRVMRFVPTSGPDVSIASVISPTSNCSLADFEPITVKVKNASGEVLSNVTLRYKVDAGSYVAESYSGTIAPYESVNFTFNQRADFSAGGSHNLEVQALMAGDINTANDSKTVVITKIVPVAMPFTEAFEGSFPPTNWTVVNPDALYTWGQSAIAGNGASTKAAYINFYDYSSPSGQKDELITPMISLSGIPKLSFNYSYSTYEGATDSLAIYIITDCGLVQVAKPIFYDGGATLATAATIQSKFFPTTFNDWKKVTIDLSAYTGQNIQIKFVSINAYGNNLYIDDVEVKDYTEITPVADFIADKTTVNAVFDAIRFTDQTTGTPTSWNWTFAGGSPATSTEQNPVVTYAAPGNYDVTLTATNSAGENTLTKTNYITVVDPIIYSAIPPTANGTSSSSRGPNPNAKYQRTAALYSTNNSLGANEINLNNGDVIKSLEFNINAPLAASNSGNIKIYLQNTSNTTFSKSTTWSTTITGMTLVYDGPLTIPNSAGFYGVTLASPFTYSGENIYVAYEWTIGTAGVAGLSYKCNTSNGTSLYSATSSTTLPATLTGSSTYRPQIRVSRELKSNDACVVSVNTLASINPGVNHIVSSVIKNTGWHAITGLNVTLDVSGANTMNEVKTIDLAIGESKTVTFTSYITASTGINTVKISIPTDDVLVNNEVSVTQTIKDAVTGISVSPTSYTLKVTQKTTLVATIAPATAGNKNVVWSSADDAIATVDQTGVVTAITVGTVKIKATAVDNSAGTFDAECDITVDAYIPVTSVVLDKETTSITIGSNETLSYTVNPVDAVNQSVIWSSSNESVATVDATGKVTAITAGTADIKIETVEGNFEDICTVTVPDLLVATITVTPATLNLYTTQTSTLTATVLPANATNKAYDWSSSNDLVATVDATGKVTAITAGTAEIRATAKDGSTVYGACDVTVIAKVDITGLTLNEITYDLNYDAVPPTTFIQLTATPIPADASNPAVTWSTSFPTIATVDATGKVTAVSIGTTVITATSVENGTISSTCTINVVPIAVTGITLSNATLNMNIGETRSITVSAIAPANATNKMVSWSSSDPTKAKVNALGKITAIGSGTVDIIATSVSDPSVTQTCAVTVANAAVGSVSLNKAYKELAETETYQLVATVFAETVPQVVDQAVTWTSSDDTKVSVDPTGLVAGIIKDGSTVTITATSVADNTKTATCQIKVVQPVSSVALDYHTKIVKSGQSFDLIATVDPNDADNKNLGWSSSNINVATVNSSGHVVSIGSGIATITATSQSDQTKSDACVVTVDNTAPIITLLGDATVEVTYGASYSDAGATAADNIDGTITSSIITTGSVTNTSPVGTYTIHYNVMDIAGNVATEVTRTVNVVKAPLTVTADNQTKTYGNANPTLTVTYNGFVNSETSAVLTTVPIASTTIDATTVVGVYTDAISVDGGVADNYSFTYVAGNFTITKADATIEITNTTFTYDGTAKSVTTSTTPASLTVNVTYDGSATAPTNAGSYAVVATIADDNYQGSQNGTLT